MFLFLCIEGLCSKSSEPVQEEQVIVDVRAGDQLGDGLLSLVIRVREQVGFVCFTFLVR